jgi:phosphatidylethanolamine N-methyltransferase
MYAFACFRVPDGLSQLVHLTRWLTGTALIAFNWWVKTEVHRVVKDYGWSEAAEDLCRLLESVVLGFR